MKAYFNPEEHSPHSYTTFNKDLINIIFPLNPWSPNWYLSFKTFRTLYSSSLSTHFIFSSNIVLLDLFALTILLT